MHNEIIIKLIKNILIFITIVFKMRKKNYKCRQAKEFKNCDSLVRKKAWEKRSKTNTEKIDREQDSDSCICQQIETVVESKFISDGRR